MTLPVLIVTGFLGAGKTTLINRMLAEASGRRIAAVVNDFGAINIDAGLIAQQSDRVIGLENGCICCSLQGDLLRVLKELISAPEPFDHLVIEASGVSDPQGIVDALNDPELWREVRLNAVLTVVDAEALADDPSRADDPLWRAQVAAADFLVLNKTGGSDALPLRTRLAAMSRAVLLESAGGELPMALLLDMDPQGDAATNPELPGGGAEPGASEAGGAWAQAGALRGPGPVRMRAPVLAGDRFVTLEYSSETPASFTLFQQAIDQLAPGLVRAKGLLNFRERPGRPLVFQMVGARATLEPWRGDLPLSQLVLIGEKDRFDPAKARALIDEVFAAPGA